MSRRFESSARRDLDASRDPDGVESSRSHASLPERRRPRNGAGVLYLVPTPIGNLEDVTLRALRILAEVDWIAAEDTRRTRVLLTAHGIDAPLRSHHAHNEHRETPRLVQALLEGRSGALVTDAGTPGISDPGFLLARAARVAGVRVVVLPGASSVLTALLASGFPPEPFLFLGYVPAPSGKRRSFLETIADEPRTVVAFETPHRLARTLALAVELLGQRRIAVARELTKMHEEVVAGTAAELLERFGEDVRGEIVLVFEPSKRKQDRKRGDRQRGDRVRGDRQRGDRARGDEKRGDGSSRDEA